MGKKGIGQRPGKGWGVSRPKGDITDILSCFWVLSLLHRSIQTCTSKSTGKGPGRPGEAVKAYPQARVQTEKTSRISNRMQHALQWHGCISGKEES